MVRAWILLLLLAGAAAAQGLTAEGVAKIDAAFTTKVEKKEVAGAVVFIARDDKLRYTGVFGNQSPGVPMRKDSIFRIYSMSKPITAVAALILVDEGKLKLDEPVTKYLPSLAGVKVHGKEANGGKPDRPATIEDLFRHTAGFSYGFGAGAVDDAYRKSMLLASRDLDSFIEKVAKLPLAYEPGTTWHYSIATDVLGAVVEKASGKRFDRFLRERILDPLGMVDTGFHVPEEKLVRFTANYSGGRVIDAPATSRYTRPATFFSGGGGLVSTAADYLRFGRMLARGGELDGKRILKRATVAGMTRSHLPDSMLPMKFGPIEMAGTGFGLGVSVQLANGEYGWAGAASTAFAIAPREGMIVITMVQVMPFDIRASATAKQLAYGALAPRPAR